MQLTKGAIGNLINRYKAVLKKCHLLNVFGSLAVAGMLVMGGAAAAGAADVASVGGRNYDSLAAAVSAAQPGETVRLLQDFTGAGIKIETGSKDGLTINLNGHTYTVTNPTVGSTGTKTNGFQLLKGGSITITNGTIVAGTDSAKILIQNYCNLTLDKVTLNGSTNTEYVLSNNHGDTTIKCGTTINAADGQHAFDAYYWPRNGYDKVSVTVEDATINGKIEYATDGTPPPSEGDHKINITGGTFTDPTAAAFIKPGENIILLTDTGAITITGGADSSQPTVTITNPDRMLHQTADIVTSNTQPKVIITTSINKASDVLPGLDSDLDPLMASVWDNSLTDVNSDAMGVRFLSRAANSGYIADAGKAAATIESAARIAFAGAVPQMTKMASDAATNAVVNRLGFANPADGAQAMNAEGQIVDRNTTGFALWIAPLWQSQHGWGMEAGNLDYGFSGNLGGVSLGADYTFENAIRAGITFNIGGGYAETSGGDLNSTENNMSFWGLGAYAGWNYENFAVMADVSYTSTWNQLKQELDPGMRMGDLEADVQATAISAGLRAEYKLETSVLDVIPHVGVRYMSLNTWGYDVDANGGTVMEGDGFHQDIWTFPVGVTFSKDFTLDSGWSVKPSIDFSVIPAAGDIKAKEDVRFTGAPTTAELETQMMDYLTWQGGVGLEMGNDTMSFGVNYTLQAGQHTTGHGVFGSFRYEF